MHVSVLTPDSKIFEGDINSLKVPGIDGAFEVLNNHAAIVSSLGAGEVKLTLTDGSKKNFTIGGGFVEVLHNQVSLLVQGVKQ